MMDIHNKGNWTLGNIPKQVIATRDKILDEIDKCKSREELSERIEVILVAHQVVLNIMGQTEDNREDI